MVKVFVSYRRDDSLHQAGRLYDRLVAQFGAEQVFKDVDSMPLGSDFRKVLTERVAGCDVFLAVIGDTWLTIGGNGRKRRLQDPGDFVRIEIEAALSREILVIPVLVGRAPVPKAHELPESLRELSFRNGLAVRPDPDFHKDVDRLIRGINDAVARMQERPVSRVLEAQPSEGPKATAGTPSIDFRAGSSPPMPTAPAGPAATPTPTPPREPTGEPPRSDQAPDRSGQKNVPPTPVSAPAPLPRRHRSRSRWVVAAAVLGLFLLGVLGLFLLGVLTDVEPEDRPVPGVTIGPHGEPLDMAKKKKGIALPPPPQERDSTVPTKSIAEAKPSPAPPERDTRSVGEERTKPVAEKVGSRVSPAPIINSIGMRLVPIPAGEFMMGSDGTDPDADEDEFLDNTGGKKEKHRVRITSPFYLGSTEVTRGQFRRFVDAAAYQTQAEKAGSSGTWQKAGFEQTDEHPVVNVSWNDAVAFAAWLSRKEGQTYRLPTEAEWEYACRAGTTTRYSHGDDPKGLATVGKIGGLKTGPVGRYNPNAWGLFDMHGNVWEWCSDGYASDYYKGLRVDDPPGPEGAPDRVIRGGGWDDGPRLARSANRYRRVPVDPYNDLGFRVARVQSVR